MGKWDLLRVGMEDRLHQPHRAKLFPGSTGEKFLSEIKNHPDCVATAISGSGPTMIAIVHGKAGKLSQAMCKIFTDGGAASHFFVLNCASSGTIVEN